MQKINEADLSPKRKQSAAELTAEIDQLRKEKKAVILAHLYQLPEIQELADYTGDSLGLAQKAAQTDAEVIVFCGVHFMAESAAILSPDKIVLLPETDAGCPMADMITAEQLQQMKQRYPQATVITYVNSSAAVKAQSDIICTSANAVKVVRLVPEDKQIIFTPDRNLGSYAAKQTGRDIILWPGYCPAHDQLKSSEVIALKKQHPQAAVLIHPEARPEVLELADVVCSTSQMISFIGKDDRREFIIGTEEGILYQLKKCYPDRKFYLAGSDMVCANMKLTTLEKVRDSLLSLQPRIRVAEEIRKKASVALQRMLEI